MAKEDLVDLDNHSEFKVSHLRHKRILLIPSQGEEGTRILTGIEGEMLYEHRQAGQVTKPEPGIMVSRVNLPEAERDYRTRVFGDQNPCWIVATKNVPGMPLDQMVVSDERLLDRIAQATAGKEKPVLYGFNQTRHMEKIAERLEIDYYGNAEFASWAGTKIGLTDFAKECGVPTPITMEIHDPSDLPKMASQLKERGYDKLVVKVSKSTGGMGHKILKIDEIPGLIRRSGFKDVLPEEFDIEEGGVVQGWVECAVSGSLATFVNFDGTTEFEGAQVHVIDKGDSAFGAVGATPIQEQYLEPMLEVGRKLSAGYSRHKAYGSHTMGMLLPGQKDCEKLGIDKGVPLVNDENTRPGATTISKAWVQAIRQGKYGTGWIVSKIKAPKGAKIAEVIEALDDSGLLINKASASANGVFVWNGSVLDSGYESKFYAASVSAADDPEEAKHFMEQAIEVFKD